MTNVCSVDLVHHGVALSGTLVTPPDPGPHPAVLVMASAMGPGPHYRAIADRLVALGYAALLTDMYGAAASFADPDAAGPHYGAITADPSLVRDRSVAWVHALAQRPEVDAGRIGAFGYCFGGFCALEAARAGADLKVVVSFHGTLSTARPLTKGQAVGELAIYTGAKDPYAPQADVDAFLMEMRAAEHDHFQLMVFGAACHSFTTVEDGGLPRAGLAYDPVADAVSWAGAVALLNQVLQPRGI